MTTHIKEQHLIGKQQKENDPNMSYYYLPSNLFMEDNLRAPGSIGPARMAAFREIVQPQNFYLHQPSLQEPAGVPAKNYDIFPGCTQKNDFELAFSNLSASSSESSVSQRAFLPIADTKSRQFSALKRTPTINDQYGLEKNFFLRESILHGCDVIYDLSRTFPQACEVVECAKRIREKTLQCRSQTKCCSLATPEQTSLMLMAYAKTFIGIADSWLNSRNCFDACENCPYEQGCSRNPEVISDYIVWMEATRNLFKSITAVLKNGDQLWNEQNALLTRIEVEAPRTSEHKVWSPQPGQTISQQYNTTTPLVCSPNFEPFPPVVPFDAAMYSSFDPPTAWRPNSYIPPCNGNVDYLKPSSYDVPRVNMTHAKKRNNITKAKSDICEKPMFKGYVVDIENNGCRRETLEDKNYKQVDEMDVTPKQVLKRNESVTMQSKSELIDESLWKEIEVEEQMQNDAAESSSNYQGEDSNANTKYSLGTKPWKILKPSILSKKVRSLPRTQTVHVNEVVQAMWDLDLPDHVKYPVKNILASDYYKIVKHPIFLETIRNRVKSSMYETIEQFVHDCRRLFHNSTLYSEGKPVEEKKTKESKARFESLLQEHFEKSGQWEYITGDLKESSYHPELRVVSSTKRKSKTQRIVPEIQDVNKYENSSTRGQKSSDAECEK